MSDNKRFNLLRVEGSPFVSGVVLPNEAGCDVYVVSDTVSELVGLKAQRTKADYRKSNDGGKIIEYTTSAFFTRFVEGDVIAFNALFVAPDDWIGTNNELWKTVYDNRLAFLNEMFFNNLRGQITSSINVGKYRKSSIQISNGLVLMYQLLRLVTDPATYSPEIENEEIKGKLKELRRNGREAIDKLNLEDDFSFQETMSIIHTRKAEQGIWLAHSRMIEDLKIALSVAVLKQDDRINGFLSMD